MYIILYYIILYYVMLCYVMLCYVMLCMYVHIECNHKTILKNVLENILRKVRILLEYVFSKMSNILKYVCTF